MENEWQEAPIAQESNLREQTRSTKEGSADMDWEDLNDGSTAGPARKLGMTGQVESLKLDNDGGGSSSRSLYSSEDESSENLGVAPKYSTETLRVRQWRRLALFLIFAAGAGVSYMTYMFLSSEETDNQKEAFEQFSNSIQDVTLFRVQNMFDGLRGFSEMITAHATRNNDTWPRVTLPNFEVVAEHIRVQTKVEFINFVPLVNISERVEFEKYAFENQGWIADSRKFTLGKEGTLKETSDYVDDEIDGVIKARCGFEFCPSPNVTDRLYAPIWQVSPPPFTPRLICSDGNNNNLVSTEIAAVKATRDSVMGPVFPTYFLTGASISKEAHDTFHDEFVSLDLGNTTADERPHFIMTTPVFEELGNRFSTVVGVILSVVSLDAYMGNLIPSTVKPIDLVVESSCNQTFTYRLDGSESSYRGPSDLHERSVDSKKTSVGFNAFLDPELSEEKGYCIYSFSLYPTREFEQSYKTPLPAVFTIVVASIFLLLASVFFIYDYMVGSEQLTAALRNEASVGTPDGKKVRKADSRQPSDEETGSS